MERCRHSDSATVDIGLHLSARDITLEIKDAGRGMFPDILQAAREEGRGLGVGLRGMQGRVTQLGGRFEIESSGRGTTVRAVLPLEAAGPFAGAP